jgi:fatty acid desaturase
MRIPSVGSSFKRKAKEQIEVIGMIACIAAAIVLVFVVGGAIISYAPWMLIVIAFYVIATAVIAYILPARDGD